MAEREHRLHFGEEDGRAMAALASASTRIAAFATAASRSSVSVRVAVREACDARLVPRPKRRIVSS